MCGRKYRLLKMAIKEKSSKNIHIFGKMSIREEECEVKLRVVKLRVVKGY